MSCTIHGQEHAEPVFRRPLTLSTCAASMVAKGRMGKRTECRAKKASTDGCAPCGRHTTTSRPGSCRRHGCGCCYFHVCGAVRVTQGPGCCERWDTRRSLPDTRPPTWCAQSFARPTAEASESKSQIACVSTTLMSFASCSSNTGCSCFARFRRSVFFSLPAAPPTCAAARRGATLRRARIPPLAREMSNRPWPCRAAPAAPLGACDLHSRCCCAPALQLLLVRDRKKADAPNAKKSSRHICAAHAACLLLLGPILAAPGAWTGGIEGGRREEEAMIR